jgi:hypothetical protein
MQQEVCKKIVLEFLAFLRYKIKNDLLTMEEIESIARMVEENLTVLGTAEDIARFYSQTTKNVTTVISRRMLEKPIRKVFYSFKAFRKIKPASWSYHKKALGIQSTSSKLR